MQELLDRLWNGWELKELLGEGSFGKVYRIEKTEFGHTYESALKVIAIPKSQSEIAPIVTVGMDEDNIEEYLYSIVEELAEEFALMAKLKGHSHIVSYEDHGVVPFEKGIGWYLCVRMELLTPLLTYEKEHPLSEADVVRMGIEICDALEACEKYNIIHRDLKPENIFVNDLGQFKIGDFGVSKQMEKTSQAFSRKGTTSFMAPEVFTGGKGDKVSDLYSLGIVLYLFLNHHRLPFYPDYPTLIRYADKEKADSMRLSGYKIPRPKEASKEVGQVIQKACAYKPGQRYQSAGMMKRALKEVSQVAAEKTETEEEQRQHPFGEKRKKMLLGLILAGVLCFSFLGIFAMTKWENPTKSEETVVKETQSGGEKEIRNTANVDKKVETKKIKTGAEEGTTEKSKDTTALEEHVKKEDSTKKEEETTKKAETTTKKEETSTKKAESATKKAEKTTKKTTKTQSGTKSEKKESKKKQDYEESLDSWDLIN